MAKGLKGKDFEQKSLPQERADDEFRQGYFQKLQW